MGARRQSKCELTAGGDHLCAATFTEMTDLQIDEVLAGQK